MTVRPWDALPHGRGFLFVDRVLELEPGVRVVGRKLVTACEAALAGHFPGKPVFPAVLLLEALAQLGGLAWLGKDAPGAGAALAAAHQVQFGRAARPGDAVDLEAHVVRVLGGTARIRATARIGEEEAVSAELTLARSPDA